MHVTIPAGAELTRELWPAAPQYLKLESTFIQTQLDYRHVID